METQHEEYTRGNGRWAKVSKINNRKWVVAIGWEGNHKADRVYHTGTKTLADEYASGWLAGY